MHMKKSLSIGFVALLLLSVITIMVPVSADDHAAQAIWVDPGSYLTAPELDTLHYCDTFTVDVMVNVTDPDGGGPATGMYGWDYVLVWDSTNINLTSYTVNIPTEWGGNWFKPKDELGHYPTCEDYHWVSVSALAPAPAVTGPRSVATYNFHVIEMITVPNPDEIGTLDLQDTKIADDLGNPIVHSTFDGEYRKCAVPIPEPVIKVQPVKVQGVCGQPFNLSIVIENLFAGWNLWGWEANLSFCKDYLCALNSFEGPFLPGFAGPNGTYYVNVINQTSGWVVSAGGFLGNHTAPFGTGVVSRLMFNACVQTIAPDIVECDFTLSGTKLVGQYPNGTLFNIPHTVENGKYNVPYKVVGWFMDCQTQKWRKKGLQMDANPTDYYGAGINRTADSFETQDLVVLYAYLEYNFQPESGKIVMFECYGPGRNISIIRTAITNCSGWATINFTIPNIPTAFGHWWCYQAAQVKIYEKPFDILEWKVGWIVEIMDVIVIPDADVKKCDVVEVIITYRTISFMPCWVLFTEITLDELLDPIQEEVGWLYVEPCEPILCSERWGNFSLYSHIPCYSHAGKATVYANAFTNFPSLCGCPYCPEATETFWIIASPCPCP